MADDIEITVSVRNLTGPGFAQINQGLGTLRTRATAAGTALRALEQRVDGAASALRTMNVLATAVTANLTHLQAETRDVARVMGQLATRTTRVATGFVELDAETNMLSRDMDQLGGSIDGVHHGMRDLGDGARHARRGVNDLGGGLDDLNNPLGEVETSAGGAAAALGGGGGGAGLSGALTGVSAVAAASALPALGALIPVMAGLGLVSGTLKMGFSGVSDAMALAGTDAKEYHKALKKMSPEQRDFTKALVGAKKEFGGVAKEVQRVMLPSFTKALKAAAPLADELSSGLVGMGEALGGAADSLSKLMKDSGFQDDFGDTLFMGTNFVKDMTDSIGPLVKSLVHFGAASQESLDAFSSGFGDLMSKGVPGFLKGLEPGIGGASKMFQGMFDALGLILPAIGRLSGALASTFGPLLGATARFAGTLTSSFLDGLLPALGELGPTADSAGDVLDHLSKIIEPLAKGFGTVLGGAIALVAPVFKNLFDLASIALPIFFDLADAIAGPLVSAFTEVTGADKGMANFGQGLKDFGNWVHDNRAYIDQGLRATAVSILDLVTAAVDAAPTIFNAFKTMVNGVLTVLGVMANAAAIGLGWIPGIGDQIKGAAGKFNEFRAGVKGSLETAGKDVQKFHDSAMPKLRDQEMRLNVSPYNAALAAAGSALKAMPDGKKVKLTGDGMGWMGIVGKASKAIKDLPARKHAKLSAQDTITAAVRAAQRAIDAMHGKTVFINYQGKSSGLVGGRLAHGGIVGAFANGGASGATGALSLVGEQGPELVRLPFGSRVYPAGQSERMMAGGEPVQAFAKGGTVTKAERAARRDAWSDLTVSRFGRMAGRSTSEFGNALGSPDSMSELVSALNKWRGIIKAATSGATERGLLRALDKTASTLLRQEKALSKVNEALGKAKDKLSSLKDAAAQLKDSVRSGIIGGANITGTAQGTGLTSTGRIIDQLTMDRDKASALAQALKQLKKRGLNAQSLSEIGQAGVSGGGLATAEALMSASGADIKQINKLESQLKKSASSAGKTTADAMYKGAIKAADVLVRALKGQQHALEKAMERVAKKLEHAIERAFKHKASGGIVGAASGGARGGLTWVGEYGPELARLPYGSSVYPAGQSRQMAMAGGGGGPIVINLSIGGRDFGQLWIDTGKREIKTRGGNVQAVLTA